MQGLTHGISCEVHTHDEIETLADNVNALYNNLLKTIHNLEQEIYKAEETEGRHITAEDTDAAVISAKLAEENNLGIGSALILKSASDGSGEQAKVFVAGIYASDSKMEIHEAGILLSIGTSVSQITMQFIYEILMVAVLVFLILIETFVIIFTVILASLPVACMKPKDILSKMS